MTEMKRQNGSSPAASAALAVISRSSPPPSPRRSYDDWRQRHRDQDRQHHARIRATPSAYGVIGKARRKPYIDRWSTTPAASTAARSPSSAYDDGYNAAQGGGTWCASWSKKRTRSCFVFNTARHALRTPPSSKLSSTPAQGAAALRRHRRLEVGQPEASSPGPWAGSRTTSPRESKVYAKHISCRPSRTPRSAMLYAERRLRQGLLQRLQAGPRRRQGEPARSSRSSRPTR